MKLGTFRAAHLWLLALTIAPFTTAHAQGTAFTYQGRLQSSTNFANGTYDFAFWLYATNVNGTAIAGVTNPAVLVTNGLFTTTVNLGNSLTGGSNWLQIAVSTNAANAFTNLSPRVQLTPVPYATFAGSANATNLVGKVQTGNLSGVALLAGGNAFTGQQTITGGSVGIGTASPAKTLDVTASASGVSSGSSVDPSVFVRLDNSSADGTLASSDAAGIGFGHNSTRQAIVGGTFGDDYLSFFTGGNLTKPRMTIADTGFLGIGTTSPNAPLTIGGQTTQYPVSLRILPTSFATSSRAELDLDNWGLLEDSGGNGTKDFAIFDYGSSALRLIIGTSGNVQVPGSFTAGSYSGNSIFNGVLSVTNSVVVDATAQNNGAVFGSPGLVFGGSSSGEGMASKRTAGGNQFGLDFYTGYSARMSVASSGNVGIGTTSPGTEKLVVAGGMDVTSPAANAGNDGGMGLSFESYGGRIQTFQNRPLTLNPIGNNVAIGKTTDGTLLDVSGDITCVAINITSDRNAKEEFKAVSAREVLNKVTALPITEWQYKAGAARDDAARHIGPMAQDFSAAFALGPDDKHISIVDEGGVALAAIQGLNEKLNEKDARIQAQAVEIDELNQSVSQLKKMVEALDQKFGQAQAAQPAQSKRE